MKRQVIAADPRDHVLRTRHHAGGQLLQDVLKRCDNAVDFGLASRCVYLLRQPSTFVFTRTRSADQFLMAEVRRNRRGNAGRDLQLEPLLLPGEYGTVDDDRLIDQRDLGKSGGPG